MEHVTGRGCSNACTARIWSRDSDIVGILTRGIELLALVFRRVGGSLSIAAALQEATPPPPCAHTSSCGRLW